MTDNHEVTVNPHVPLRYRLRWYTFEQINAKINNLTQAVAHARHAWIDLVTGGIDQWAETALTEGRLPQDADERADWYAADMTKAYHEWVHLNSQADALFARWGHQLFVGFDFVDDLVTEEAYLDDKEAADAAEEAMLAVEDLH